MAKTTAPRAPVTPDPEVTTPDPADPEAPVLYVSAFPESAPFHLNVGPWTLHSFWDAAKTRLEWYVPREAVEPLSRHFLVQSGRIKAA